MHVPNMGWIASQVQHYMSLPASPQLQDPQEKNIAAGMHPVEVLLD